MISSIKPRKDNKVLVTYVYPGTGKTLRKVRTKEEAEAELLKQDHEHAAKRVPLPSGWTAYLYQGVYELEHADGRIATIPLPYERQSVDWWREQIATSIKEAEAK